jgi:hypothetical protein
MQAQPVARTFRSGLDFPYLQTHRMRVSFLAMMSAVWALEAIAAAAVKPLAGHGVFNAAVEATVGGARRPALKNRATQYHAKTCR